MRLASAVLVSLLATSGIAADFSGKWSLDVARSVNIPPGLEQTVTIEQKGDALSVSTAIISDGADRIVRDTYTIGASDYDIEPQMAGLATTSAKRSVRRTGDGAFESTDRIEGSNANGPVSMQIERKWQLSPDGSTLTVEQAVTNSGYTTTTKRVLTRGGSTSPREPVASRLFPLDLTIPVAPTAFRAGGKTNLAYEVHVTNFRNGDVEWKRLDILGDDGKQLASYSGADLASMLTRPGAPGTKDVQKIPAGGRAVAFVWVQAAAAPQRLHHRAIFGLPASAAGSERVVEGGDTRVVNTPTVLGPPVRGGDWIARWIGPTSFHRRSLMVVDGGAHIAQRFAIDWNRIGPDSREWHGEGKSNDEYSVYGQEVIAVADGVIARVIDSIPPNKPGSMNPAVPLSADTATGNSVSLRLPNDAYAVYAHLQPGSIRVKEGQRVRRGDVLGLIGNSGNAVGPHLHFHLATAPGLQGEGLPYVFDSFKLVGQENGPPKDDGTFNGTPVAAEERRNEMPAEHMLVRF